MGVQTSTTHSNKSILINGNLRSRYPETMEQDAGRVAALAQWTVLGKKSVDVPTTGTAGTNTGDGTMTAVSAAGPLKVGTYTLECTFAVTNGGVFKLTDPDSVIVADNLTLRVGDGLLTTFVAGGLKFTITEGTNDFAAADTFTVAVTANGKYVPLNPAALDGSQKFAGIYNGSDITAAALVAGDVDGEVIIGGDGATLNADNLVIETGTLDTVLASGVTLREEMYTRGLFPGDTKSSYGPENA